MKKTLLILTAVASMGLFANCATIQTSTTESLSGEKLALTGTTIGHVNANNWGLYFFPFAIITGNDTQPGSISFFHDNVKIERQADLVTAKVKEMGGTKAINMTSLSSSFGFIFYINKATVSANAMK